MAGPASPKSGGADGDASPQSPQLDAAADAVPTPETPA
jgi:hypothetical protein